MQITIMLLLATLSFILFLNPPFVFSTPIAHFPHHPPRLTNASDQHALLAFKSAITYDPSQCLATSWMPNVSFCEWTGIICSRRRQRVVSLNVTNMGLEGYMETSRRGPGRSRKMKETVTDRVRKAEQAFLRFSNQAVRRVMQKLEEEAIQDQSEEEVEDWTFLLHDTGQTRGRMSLYKQSLHLYWVMKGILAKALLQVSKEMVNLAKGGPDIRLELSFLRVAMLKQEEAMLRMETKLTTIQHILTPEHQEQVTEATQQPVRGHD